jgi:hypothetical protein
MALRLDAVRRIASDLDYTVERAAVDHGLPMHDVWDADDHYLGRLTLRGLRLLIGSVSEQD